MITDQETNTIYFADEQIADEQTANAYRSIRDYLRNEGVQIRLLKGTRDVWARDFMPIQVSEDKFVKFNYNPPYLDNDRYRHTITSNDEVLKICQEEGIAVTLSDINLDGGNLVKCNNAVILTDRVMALNPQYSASRLVKELERLLEAEIFIIPSDPEEKIYGHSDGVLSYLDGNRLLVTRYPDAGYISKVKMALGHHFEFVDLWMTSDYAKCRENYLWAYINYIRTKDFILLPGLSEHCDCKEDQTIFREFQQIFPEYAKKNTIIQVYTLPLLKKEGGLHCASWNIRV